MACFGGALTGIQDIALDFAILPSQPFDHSGNERNLGHSSFVAQFLKTVCIVGVDFDPDDGFSVYFCHLISAHRI